MLFGIALIVQKFTLLLEPSHCKVQDRPRVSTSFQVRELYLSTRKKGALYVIAAIMGVLLPSRIHISNALEMHI